LRRYSLSCEFPRGRAAGWSRLEPSLAHLLTLTLLSQPVSHMLLMLGRSSSSLTRHNHYLPIRSSHVAKRPETWPTSFWVALIIFIGYVHSLPIGPGWSSHVWEAVSRCASKRNSAAPASTGAPSLKAAS